MGFILGLTIAIIVIFVMNKRMKTKEDELRIEMKMKEDIIQGLNRRIDDIKKGKENIEEFSDEIKELEQLKKKIQEEIEILENDYMCTIVDISSYDGITSEECKNKLSMLKIEINELIKNEQAVVILSEDKSKKEITANKKQILLCFNAECSGIINNLSTKNVDSSRSRIEKAFANINKIFEVDGLQLSNVLLEKKLEELTLVYAAVLKREQEKEEQRAIREQMLEEEKVRREIEREKAKIEKEEAQFKNEISKLMEYMHKASDVEKQLYVDKIHELEEKLRSLEKDKENVFEREQNTRAGFVYIISNLGSFGENIYKIGMTRRLEPLDRVKELGDASVPFEFDVHAMIFSDDAPALENTLHNTFRGKEVNKVNLRKEFFKVTLDEIEKVVKENHNATVTFTKVAEALQYRESLRIEQEKA